jgi:hypothetical protein
MTAVAKRRLAALSEQLVAPIGDQGKFEDLPVLKKIAPDSNGPRVQGKVVIVTGQCPAPLIIHHGTDPINRSEFSSGHWSRFRTSVRTERSKGDIYLRL